MDQRPQGPQPGPECIFRHIPDGLASSTSSPPSRKSSRSTEGCDVIVDSSSVANS